jgi:hypothetical protein
MKKKFRSLDLIARKYLDTFSSGNHPTLLKDSLIEVDVVREYQPGDKRLDSKSSLKSGRAMSRVFNPEKSLNLFIVLDLSSSQYSKLDAAVITALYLAYLGDINGERMGLCLCSDKGVKVLDLSDDYGLIVGAIEKSWNTLQMNAPTSVEMSLKKVGELGLQNSLVVLISDFCYPVSEILLNGIKKISLVPTNSFTNVVLYNPLDWFASIAGFWNFGITLKDAESGTTGQYLVDSAKSDFDEWSADLKKKLLGSYSDVIFLDVKQERFLLPLVKHLMRV